jgi:hypothetical protein
LNPPKTLIIAQKTQENKPNTIFARGPRQAHGPWPMTKKKGSELGGARALSSGSLARSKNRVWLIFLGFLRNYKGFRGVQLFQNG